MRIVRLDLINNKRIYNGLGKTNISIDLSRDDHRKIVIFGRNGAGKSTLLSALSGIPLGPKEFLEGKDGMHRVVFFHDGYFLDITYEYPWGKSGRTKTLCHIYKYMDPNGSDRQDLNPSMNMATGKEIIYDHLSLDPNFEALSTFSSQKRGLIDMTSVERLKYVNQILPETMSYNELHQALSKRSNSWRTQANVIMGKLHQLGDATNIEGSLNLAHDSLVRLTKDKEKLLAELYEYKGLVKVKLDECIKNGLDLNNLNLNKDKLNQEKEVLRETTENIAETYAIYIRKLNEELADHLTISRTEFTDYIRYGDLGKLLKPQENLINQSFLNMMSHVLDRTLEIDDNDIIYKTFNALPLRQMELPNLLDELDGMRYSVNMSSVECSNKITEYREEYAKVSAEQTVLRNSNKGEEIHKLQESLRDYHKQVDDLTRVDSANVLGPDGWQIGRDFSYAGDSQFILTFIEKFKDKINDMEDKLLPLEPSNVNLDYLLNSIFNLYDVIYTCSTAHIEYKTIDIIKFFGEKSFDEVETLYENYKNSVDVISEDKFNKSIDLAYEQVKDKVNSKSIKALKQGFVKARKEALEKSASKANLNMEIIYETAVLFTNYYNTMKVLDEHFPCFFLANDDNKKITTYTGLMEYALRYGNFNFVDFTNMRNDRDNDYITLYNSIYPTMGNIEAQIKTLSDEDSVNQTRIHELDEELKNIKEKSKHYVIRLQFYSQALEVITKATSVKLILKELVSNISNMYKDYKADRDRIGKETILYNENADRLNEYHQLISSDKESMLKNSIKKVEEEIRLQERIKGEAEYKLKTQKSLMKDLVEYNTYVERLDTLKKYCAPSSGVQVLFVNLYMNKILSISNEILQHFFGGRLSIHNFVINEKEFKISCMAEGGLLIDDVSSMSSSQKAIISAILSAALLRHSSSIYNILRLDEIDGPLDPHNRSAFFDQLDTMLKIFNIDQCFIVSLNQEIDYQDIGAIILGDNDRGIDQRNIIAQL